MIPFTFGVVVCLSLCADFGPGTLALIFYTRCWQTFFNSINPLSNLITFFLLWSKIFIPMMDKDSVITLFQNLFATKDKTEARTIINTILFSLGTLGFYDLNNTKSREEYSRDFDSYIYTLGMENDPNTHFAITIYEDVLRIL